MVSAPECEREVTLMIEDLYREARSPRAAEVRGYGSLKAKNAFAASGTRATRAPGARVE